MNKLTTIVFALLTQNVMGSRLLDRFDNWVNEFNVQIFDDVHRENLIRNWKINDEYIELVNGRNLSYTLAHNHLSGLSSKEYTEFLGFEKSIKTPNSVSSMETSNYGLPTSVNWVDMGAVTTVKDQGQCGSCWSFSTTGALEGAYFVKYGSLPSFSEQQLVDCDTLRNGGKDHGCNGGLMDNAFSWIEKNNGLCVETDYPYTSGITKTGGTCQTTCSVNTKSAVKSIVDVRPSSDNDMMAALSKQPVSIAIEADQKDFQLYSSGVFTGQCGTGLDHGVLAVGYGTLSGQDYYLVKNSWSSSWGDNGYIRLGRGPQFNNGDGQCGMLLEASYPVL
jgi:C1A family cysteine protease